jgi:hypothetical protein
VRTKEEWVGFMSKIRQESELHPERSRNRAKHLLCDLLCDLGYKELADEWITLDGWYK